MSQAIYNFIVGLPRMLVNNPEPAYGLLTDQTHFKLYCLELARDSMNKEYSKLSYHKLNYRQANPDCCSLSQVDNYIKTNTTLIKLLAGIIQNKTKNLPQIANFHANSNDNHVGGKYYFFWSLCIDVANRWFPKTFCKRGIWYQFCYSFGCQMEPTVKMDSF